MRNIKNAQAFFDKPLVLFGLTFLIFSSLLFINIRHDHDWGGDFAQYLSQAENITHFRAMDETGYIYNEAFTTLGPRVYPPGFPLIIAPMTHFFGNQTIPYNYLLSFILIACGILTVLLLKKCAGVFPAVLLSIVIYYNPYFIVFKSEILADLPFALCFLGFILLTFNNTDSSIRQWIMAGVLAGVASSIKSVGNIIFLALFAYSLQLAVMEWIKYKNYKICLIKVMPIFISIIVGIALTFLLNLISLHRFHVSTGYSDVFNLGESMYKTVGDNIVYYSEIVRTFFIKWESTELWFTTLFGSAVITFFITGLIISFNKKPKLVDWITLFYFGTLLLYPYQKSGFRFLIPVAPLIFYYASLAVIRLNPGKGGIALVTIVSSMMLFQYTSQIQTIQDSVENVQEGPYSPQVVSAFEKVRELTTSEDVIVFIKPRVLHRYTERKSMSHKPGSTIAEMEHQYSIYNPNFFLLYSGLTDSSLEQFVNENNDKLDLIWGDDFFKLFKVRAEN